MGRQGTLACELRRAYPLRVPRISSDPYACLRPSNSQWRWHSGATLRLILTVTILFTLRAHSSAECVAVQPCEALQRSSIVFVGDALSVGPTEERTADNGHRFASQQFVHFLIVEHFKGLPEDKKEIEAIVADTDGAEAVRFTANRRYVVYVKVRLDGKWLTACSPSRALARPNEVERHPNELRELRACARR